MAASNSPHPSSPSESDSDREPNSHGARVFWGNLKTPEKSRSAFVDPPQTVVRTQPALHIQSTRKSARLSTAAQDHTKLSPAHLKMMEEYDEPFDPVRSNNHTMKEETQTQEQYEATHPPFESSSNDGDDTNQVDASLDLSNTPSMSPQLGTTNLPLQESGSESEIERDPILQRSSFNDTLSPSDSHAQEPFESPCQLATHTAVALFTGSAITPEPRGPRASELPDLISFDIPTPPRHSLLGFQSRTSPCSSFPPSNQLSSSSATVDDLLTLSPIQPKSPLLQPQLFKAQTNSLDQEADAAIPFSTSGPEVSHQSNASTEIEAELAVGINMASVETGSPITFDSLEQEAAVNTALSTCESQAGIAAETDPSGLVQPIFSTSSFESASDIDTSPLDPDVTTSNSCGNICTAGPSTAEDRPATAVLNLLDVATSHKAQEVAISLSSPSRGETRKRSPAKGSKGKEKAHIGDNSSNESSSNTSSEYFSSLRNGDESASDKAAKKERRAKVKHEAERRRQQLVSLSPTSANVLSMLASPDRDSPVKPIGLDEAVSDFAMKLDLPNRSTSAEPETPRKNSATRVPISLLSPRRSEGSPLRFKVPAVINLDDPNRTPARRIPLPPEAQTPRPLPLDDPNRTPARRVPIHSSPTRPAEPTDPPAPQIQIEESSPVKQTTLSSAKLPTDPPSLNSHDKNISSSSSLSPTIDVPRPLPFPIRQKEGTTAVAPIRTSRPTIESGTEKPLPASKLRQPSLISTSKIARIATKPYSRPVQGLSRSPASWLRHGASSSSTTTGAGPSRPHPSPVNLAPSRIPSPSKRSSSFVKPIDPPTTISTTTSTEVNSAEDKAHSFTAYKRKRQRMISEDDPDEPSAKRPVIMVRPVIKGMYNKSSTQPRVSVSAMIQREGSPVRPSRPPGPIHIRPVIPGTLRHFETTRSSSRDFLDDSEQENNPDIHPNATEPSSDLSMEQSSEREETPLVDTDTASTVTTLSREPTLEELPNMSAPRSETPVSNDSRPEPRRTTRARKPYGPDAPELPSTPGVALRRDPMPLTRTTSMIQGEGGSLYPKGSSRSSTRAGVPQEGLPLNSRQLQALTDANTLRNQTCLADLERKIVRRYGPRPASPSTKIRTIMEKSREGHSKEREKRAERRRRREQGSNMSASSDGDYMDAPSSPTSDRQLSESGPLTKHARGPGDEEDYETPVRPPTTSQVDRNKLAKTVKWDRGLARTVSDWAAEQLAKKARQEAAVEPIPKGCLVRDRTTLRLDPLGNVPNANEPLEDLGPEHVIVTRFVYDDDVEATRMTKRKRG